MFYVPNQAHYWRFAPLVVRPDQREDMKMRKEAIQVATIQKTEAASDLLAVPQLAARLQVKPSYVLEKTRARCPSPIPAVRLGRYLRFRWGTVLHWLDQMEGVATEKRVYRRRRKTKAAKAQKEPVAV